MFPPSRPAPVQSWAPTSVLPIRHSRGASNKTPARGGPRDVCLAIPPCLGYNNRRGIRVFYLAPFFPPTRFDRVLQEGRHFMLSGLHEQASDEAVMRAVQQGHDAKFSLLVERYQGPLRRVAYSRLGNIELAEDIVQDAFLAAFQSRHTFATNANFRTWLWTILLNRCRRHFLRQSGKSAIVPWSQLPQAGVAAEPAVEPSVPGFENSELLESLLRKLAEPVADALRLRFFGQLSFQEIADTVDCSLGTAKNRVRLGLLQMSQALREAEEVPAGASSTAPRVLPRNEP